jgi:hypothetical protein
MPSRPSTTTPSTGAATFMRAGIASSEVRCGFGAER